MTDSSKSVSTLRRRLLDDMTMRKLEVETQAAYIRAVKNFTRFFGRSHHRTSHERSPGIFLTDLRGTQFMRSCYSIGGTH